MSQRLVRSPRIAVSAAVTVLVVLAGLLVFRVMARERSDSRTDSASRLPAKEIAAATVPVSKPIVIEQLAIPSWSSPGAEASKLSFRTDLDLLAPLGTGRGNAAEWFAMFTKPDGARAGEADAIMNRRIDHPTLGKLLPASDPFVAEAQPWLDQATMRFYPDVYAVEGFRTKVPNFLLALTLARSFVARGQTAERFDDAMADFQRVVRLGRLFRQDDASVINDLIGLAAIRMGVDAIYDRARHDGRLDLALAAAVIAGEAPAQKLLSAARMTTAEVVPYLHRAVGGSSVEVPAERFEGIRQIALESPDRRFRVIACASLSLVASFGSGDQQAQAKELLQTLSLSTDTIVAGNARWHLTHPMDEQHLDQLLAKEK